MGDEGLKKVEALLAQLGHPINYKNLKAMGWFPAGIRALSLLAIKESFSWSDDDIKMMGNTAPKYSFIIKTMMQYFLSPDFVLKNSGKFWRKHWTVGDLEPGEYNKQENTITIYLKGFSVHPIFCKFLEGYFARVVNFTLPDKTVQSKEIECSFKGAPHHAFKLWW